MNARLKKTEDQITTKTGSDEIDLKELLMILTHHKWFIAAAMAIFLGITTLLLLQISPTYQSTALIQVQNQQSGLDMLQGLGIMDGMMSKATAALPSQIETALMQSRYILKPTILTHHLNIIIKPYYFPIFGKYKARHFKGFDHSSGNSRYAWGGEKLKIDYLDIPLAMFNAKFLLIAGKKGFYRLYSPSGQLLIKEGCVGHLERVRDKKLPKITLRVTELKAHPNTHFTIIRTPVANVMQGFKKQLLIKDQNPGSTSSHTATGILQLSLSGHNAEILPSVLNTVIRLDVQKNIEKKTAEAEQTLKFLSAQLPIVKRNLDRAESALSEYRSKTGTLGLSMEAKAMLDELVNLEKMQETLKLQKSELLLRFTDQFPLVRAVDSKEAQMKNELQLLRTKISMLPAKEQRAINLERDVQVKTQMYLLMMNKMQQLRVAKAGMISDIQVLGTATRAQSLPSRTKLMLLGSLIFGFILAVLIIFIRKLLSHSIDDPDYVEERLNIPAYAIIPHSKRQEQLTRDMRRNIPGTGPFVLADIHSKDLAIEGLRSLRTALQFSLMEAGNNIISIMGASPSIGKSFISLNLAYILADAGKKVLLIDADMRKGKINRYLSVKPEPGFSEWLKGDCTLNEVKREMKKDFIDFIPSGKYPQKPSELLIHARLGDLLKTLSEQYDIVLIDTAPVLAVTDAMLIARHSATNLLLVGSGKEHLPEIEHAVKRIEKNHIRVNGLIFNNLNRTEHSYSYGNYRYNYYYDYEKKKH